MAILEVANVSKFFGPVIAVENLSFFVERGEIISLLGPSGCGKTTTLRLIAGFEDPDGGYIRINGVDMASKRPYERNVGLLFQNYALFPHMSVYDNIAFGLRHRGWPRDQLRGRVDEMLDLVKLAGSGAKFPAHLSGGQQQRIALARALATQPEVLLLDEPLSALDAKLRLELRIELKEILRTVGSTALIVTHDQEEAMSMAERVIILRDGRMQQEGLPDVVYSKPNSRFVAEFVGRSNWITGVCETPETDPWIIECDEGLTLTIPARADGEYRHFDIGIRPESLEVVSADDPGSSSRPVLKGVVVDVGTLGPERQVMVQFSTGKQMLAIDRDRSENIHPGQRVVLRVRVCECIVLPREA